MAPTAELMAWPHVVVVFLAAYLPLEEFLLKWVPVPGDAYLALRQLPDLAVFSLAAVYLAAKLARRGSLRVIGGGADFFLVAFLFVAIAGVAIRGANPFTVLLNLKALLRYVLLVYVLLNTRLSTRTYRLALAVAGVSVAIQAAIALSELVGGAQARAFFLPRDPSRSGATLELAFTAFRESERGFVFGTVGNTIGFAMFMLVGLTLLLSSSTRARSLRMLGVVGLMLLIVSSGSRAALLAGALIIIFYGWRYRPRLTLALTTATLLAASLIIARLYPGLIEVVTTILDDYRIVALNQRLGILVFVLPAFLVSGLDGVAMGLTADRQLLARFINDVGQAPILVTENVATIEDVYWVALLVYYGMVGFAALLCFLLLLARRLYRILRFTPDPYPRRCAEISLLLLAVLPLLNLFNQALEVRLYSYFLWLFVGVSLAAAPIEWVADPRPKAESSRVRSVLRDQGRTGGLT